MSLVVDIHALHSLPPSNINRDDTGAPKSAVFGGVPRQRVSSQSWKRAIRHTFEHTLDKDAIGYRTKRVAGLIATRIMDVTAEAGDAWPADRAEAAVKSLFAVTKIKLTEVRASDGEPTRADETGYLLFLSSHQIERAAQALIAADGAKLTRKDALDLLDSEHSVDIAMFGRMVADDPTFNVDASVQVAHAIGIHESEPEFDYYTAVDDVVEDNEETGAGMIGTMQMMSSTLYRFATVDVDGLTENLGDREAALNAVSVFLDAFITSLPTGKQNSYAHNTLPELVYVCVRDSRSVSLVNAFEEPVRSGDERSRRQQGAERLAKEASEVESQYGFVPLASFVIGLGNLRQPFQGIAEETTLPELSGKVGASLSLGEKP